jgi:hypothetical protein
MLASGNSVSDAVSNFVTARVYGRGDLKVHFHRFAGSSAIDPFRPEVDISLGDYISWWCRYQDWLA